MRSDNHVHGAHALDEWLDRDRLLQLVESLELPGYVLYLPHVRRQVAALRKALGPRFTIYYAVKANPHRRLLETLAGLGVGADVASLGELQAALSAGMKPRNISFSGPGKTGEELSAALEHGIGAINVEGLEELDELIRLAERLDRPAHIGLRINPGAGGARGGLRMAGDTQFGIDESLVPAVVERLATASARWVRFAGLHVHAGSQILDPAVIVDHVRGVMDLALRLEHAGIPPMSRINFGGGWGVSYFSNQHPLDVTKVGSELAAMLARPPYRDIAARAELILEPGRWLVAEAGIYVARVLYRKRSGRKEFAIVDGGMHHNYLLAGGMGQVIRRNFALIIIPPRGARREPVDGLELDIAGRLCTPQDVLATGVQVEREVLRGDYVVFLDCGAYGWTASPVDFLSHPRPALHLIE